MIAKGFVWNSTGVKVFAIMKSTAAYGRRSAQQVRSAHAGHKRVSASAIPR